MNQQELNRAAQILLTFFLKQYRAKYKIPLSVNRYRVKWGFQDMIKDVGADRAKEIILYYFKTANPGHPIDGLLYNYDKLDKMMKRLDEQKARRAKLLEETNQRLKNGLRSKTD